MAPTTSPARRRGLSRATAATVGGHRLRVTPWQGHAFIALIGPSRAQRSPTPSEILACIEALRQRGVTQAVTPALSAFEAEPFFQAGFTQHEALHLLARYIDTEPPKPTHRLRRGRPWDRPRVLELDSKAFEQFWQFDSFSLKEARRATPAHRFTVAVADGDVTGYAVTGRAGGRGYLQRLAVDPNLHGQGIGSSLVHDCLRWLHRKGVGMALVNTQERNTRALELYERLGFVRQREGLLVLRWDEPA
ncbi:MAG: GNAT family N-acetyltransferase [Acidimicrobiia bacterium]|nr:GNAT family N-acetyltransferase [Acidimicrobiia bacterium]